MCDVYMVRMEIVDVNDDFQPKPPDFGVGI